MSSLVRDSKQQAQREPRLVFDTSNDISLHLLQLNLARISNLVKLIWTQALALTRVS